MNLKEKLEEAKANLAEVKEAVESGEKGADELDAAIDGVKSAQKAVEAADEAHKLIESLGSNEGPADIDEPASGAKSMGEHFVKFAAGKMDASQKFAVTAPAFEKTAAVQTLPTTNNTFLTTVKPDIVEGKREQIAIADLFSQAPITEGNSVTYCRTTN